MAPQCPGRCHDNALDLTGHTEMKSSLRPASLPGVTRDRISTGRGHRCDYRSIGPEGGKNVGRLFRWLTDLLRMLHQSASAVLAARYPHFLASFITTGIVTMSGVVSTMRKISRLIRIRTSSCVV